MSVRHAKLLSHIAACSIEKGNTAEKDSIIWPPFALIALIADFHLARSPLSQVLHFTPTLPHLVCYDNLLPGV